jgi:uncharacterized membrane protein
MLLQTYYRYGKENLYAVPKFLSFVPNPERKPWLVNLIFKGDAVDFDENAFFATLTCTSTPGEDQDGAVRETTW